MIMTTFFHILPLPPKNTLWYTDIAKEAFMCALSISDRENSPSFSKFIIYRLQSPIFLSSQRPGARSEFVLIEMVMVVIVGGNYNINPYSLTGNDVNK